MTDKKTDELIDLLNKYGEAKFGDEWWPGNASAWIDKEKAARLEELLENPGRHGPLLLAQDEIHVVLDCLPSSDREIGAPWDGYDTDPVDDPKSTKTGWWRLLRSAQEKLNAELSRL